MKKLLLVLLAAFASICLSAVPSYSQHQRLGIRPQEIVLDAEKPSKTVEAYCFDRHVVIDDAYDYRHLHTDGSAVKVIVGKKTYSFSNAIKEGVIKVSGRPGDQRKGEPQLVIEITKLVPDAVTVRVAKATVFRDQPGTYKNQKALDALSATNVSAGRQGTQDLIWEADLERSRLETLGYKSKDDFRKSHANASDDQLSANLKRDEDALIQRFEAAHIFARRTDTRIQSASDNVRSLQQLYGVKETGVFGDDVNALFKRYEMEYLPSVRETVNLSRASNSYVLKVKSTIGDDKLYTVYTPFGVFRSNNTDALTQLISALSNRDKGIFLDLEFPSREKIDGFITTFNVASRPSVTMIEGTPAAKDRFFNSGNVTRLVSSSPAIKTQGGFGSTLVVKTDQAVVNQKVTVTAKARRTVTKFVRTFRSLINGKRNVPSIASEARRVSGSVALGFEVHRIQIIRRSPEKFVEVASK